MMTPEAFMTAKQRALTAQFSRMNDMQRKAVF